MTGEDPKQLAAELLAAYKFLCECVPLALKQLQLGGVSALDQMAFWEAIEIPGLDTLSFAEHAGSLNYDENGLPTRIGELEIFLNPELAEI